MCGSADKSKTRQSFCKLLEGVDRFRATVYPELRESYVQTIREGQKPHALFITCADSRIAPEALTQSKPGIFSCFGTSAT